jgi:ankyrin repeat domain-containing protein 50
MEGVAAASAVIAVVEMAAKVGSACWEYYVAVKDARKDIERLKSEIESLHHVLVKVADLSDSPGASQLETLNLLALDGGPLEQCKEELGGLEKKLNPNSDGNGPMRKFGLRALKWPFTSKEIDKSIVVFERIKSLFSVALNTDQT